VERYKRAGAGDVVTLIVAQGQGHNLWEGFFHCQELVSFAVERAKAGAEPEKAGNLPSADHQVQTVGGRSFLMGLSHTSRVEARVQ
jgi:hypothetical protein